MEHKKKIIENNLPPNIDWSSLVQGLEIGKGSFSQVFQFYNSNKHEEIYAVKLIKSDEETLDKIKEEIDFFEKNKEIPEIQKYLITYYGYVHFKQKFNNLKTENYALLFEMAQGTIVNLIKKRSKSLSFNEIIDMSESVSNVLYAFQKKKIAHRDIKPANILYFEDKDKTIFKIIDFGEVKLQVENQGTIKGTPLYFAPEENYLYMKNEDFLKEQYNPFKSDVYSFALTIIFAALENLPFTKNQNALPVEGERLKSCMKRIEERFKDPFKENIGPYDNLLQESVNKIIENFKGNRGLKDFKKLLLNMLEYNPNNRCDWETVKKTIKKIKEKNKVFSCEQCSKKDKEIEQLKKEIAHKNQCLQILAERTSRILKELDHEKNSRCTAETNLSEILSKDSFVCQEQIIEKEKEKVVEKPIIEEKIIIEEKKEEPQEDKKMISKLNLIMDALLSNKKEEILIDENKLIEIPINDKTDIIAVNLDDLNFMEESRRKLIKKIEFQCQAINEYNVQRFYKNSEELNVFTSFKSLKKLKINLENSTMNKLDLFEMIFSFQKLPSLKSLYIKYSHNIQETWILNDNDLEKLFSGKIPFPRTLTKLSLEFQYNGFTADGIMNNAIVPLFIYLQLPDLERFRLNVQNQVSILEPKFQTFNPPKKCSQCFALASFSSEEIKMLKNGNELNSNINLSING